jgi:DNA-binding beta-propeller fold protein YncE
VPGAALRNGLARATAVVLAGIIVVGGAIDLVPIKNDGPLGVPMAGDRLFDWVRDETDPDDVFLTDIHIVHPILLAGRAIFFGHPVYSLSYGYDLGPREREYKELLTMRSPRELVRQLQEDGIRYVTFDDPMRERGYAGPDLNEDIFREHLDVAFDDPANEYGNLVIFAVPEDPAAWQALPGAPAVDAFTGGFGRDPGRFDGPRGLGLGPDGSIAVADTLNHRIELFEADGTFRAEIGELGVGGAGEGQFNEPGGVALGPDGHVWVADTLNHRLVELDPGGGVVSTWSGPEPGFYGPRDVAVGADGAVWVLDQGRARVVRRDPDGTVTSFGTFGTGEGQLNDPTGLAVGADHVYVADTANRRIVVLDLDGAPVAAWPVDEWDGAAGFPDVAVDEARGRVYASVPMTGAILAWDLAELAWLDPLAPDPDVELTEPGAIAVAADGTVIVVDRAANRLVAIEPARQGR